MESQLKAPYSEPLLTPLGLLRDMTGLKYGEKEKEKEKEKEGEVTFIGLTIGPPPTASITSIVSLGVITG